MARWQNESDSARGLLEVEPASHVFVISRVHVMTQLVACCNILA